MPYNITWNADGVVWTFYDTLTGQDAIQANLDIYGYRRFDELLYSIVDLSKVRNFEVAVDDLEAAAALDEAATSFNPRLLVAVIAPGEEAVKVAQSYKSAMAEAKWKVEIFGTMRDAEEWINRNL